MFLMVSLQVSRSVLIFSQSWTDCYIMVIFFEGMLSA